MHCVLNVGGNWNNRSNAGLFYFNGNNSTSNSNSNIGAHIIYKKLGTWFFYCIGFSSPLGENCTIKAFFSSEISKQNECL